MAKKKQEFGFQDWTATEGQEFGFVGTDGGEGAKSTWDVQAKVAQQHGGRRYAQLPPARRFGMGQPVNRMQGRRKPTNLLAMAAVGAGAMLLLYGMSKKRK